MADDTFVLTGGISESKLNTTPTPSTSGVTGNLEYAKMLTKNKLTVRIACPNGKLIKSGIAQDFQVNLGNQWSELVPWKSVPLIGDLSQGAFAVATATLNATQGSLEALWMSSASWSSSKLPRFMVTLTYLNYSKKAPFINDMLALAGGALTPGPYVTVDKTTGKATDGSSRGGDIAEFVNYAAEKATQAQQFIGDKIADFASENLASEDGQNESVMYKVSQDLSNLLTNTNSYGTAAPYDYGLQQDKAGKIFVPKPNTTFALEIGNWFKAKDLLVEDITPTFSKEVVRSGNPVLMNISVTFRPYRNMTFKDFCDCFQIK